MLTPSSRRRFRPHHRNHLRRRPPLRPLLPLRHRRALLEGGPRRLSNDQKGQSRGSGCILLMLKWYTR